MRRPAPTAALTAALLSGVLLAGCSGSGDATPSAAPSSAAPSSAATAGTPSATPTADPYADLAPPVSPGVGGFEAPVANRGYEAAHGLLALQLLEPSTLTGGNRAELVQQLTGGLGDASIAQDLGGAPTRRGLDYRPLFPAGTRLGTPFVEVVRSSYTADEVQGRAGESGLRISWSGAVRYHVVVGGTPRTVGYALSIAYVFGRVPQEPNGLGLQLVVRGSAHAAPVLTSCLAKGLLVPTAGAPTAADLGKGPYPSPAPGPACPV